MISYQLSIRRVFRLSPLSHRRFLWRTFLLRPPRGCRSCVLFRLGFPSLLDGHPRATVPSKCSSLLFPLGATFQPVALLNRKLYPLPIGSHLVGGGGLWFVRRVGPLFFDPPFTELGTLVRGYTVLRRTSPLGYDSNARDSDLLSVLVFSAGH